MAHNRDMKEYIKNLHTGQMFLLPGSTTLAKVEKVASGTGVTRVNYISGGTRWEFSRPSLTMVTLPFN